MPLKNPVQVKLMSRSRNIKIIMIKTLLKYLGKTESEYLL